MASTKPDEPHMLNEDHAAALASNVGQQCQWGLDEALCTAVNKARSIREEGLVRRSEAAQQARTRQVNHNMSKVMCIFKVNGRNFSFAESSKVFATAVYGDPQFRRELREGNYLNAVKVVARALGEWAVLEYGSRLIKNIAIDIGLDKLANQAVRLLKRVMGVNVGTAAWVAAGAVLVQVFFTPRDQRKGPRFWTSVVLKTAICTCFSAVPAALSMMVVDWAQDGYIEAQKRGGGVVRSFRSMVYSVVRRTLLVDVFFGEDPTDEFPPLPSDDKLLMNDEVHDEFLCPIMHEVLEDPVFLDGVPFGRAAINSWFDEAQRQGHPVHHPTLGTRTARRFVCPPPLDWYLAYINYIDRRYELLRASNPTKQATN